MHSVVVINESPRYEWPTLRLLHVVWFYLECPPSIYLFLCTYAPCPMPCAFSHWMLSPKRSYCSPSIHPPTLISSDRTNALTLPLHPSSSFLSTSPCTMPLQLTTYPGAALWLREWPGPTNAWILLTPSMHLTLPDRKSTRLNSSHSGESRMPSSA